jgi:hypothetical protein
MLQIKIIYVQKRDGKNDKIVNFINFLFFYDEYKCIFNVLVFFKKKYFLFFLYLIFYHSIFGLFIIIFLFLFFIIFFYFFIFFIYFFEKKILCFILYTLNIYHSTLDHCSNTTLSHFSKPLKIYLKSHIIFIIFYYMLVLNF